MCAITISEKKKDETIAIQYFFTKQMIADGFITSLFLTQQNNFIKYLSLEKKLIFEY